MNYRSLLLNALTLASLFVFLSACGGGSGESSDASGEILTGQFIDSPVSGLSYYTETLEGVTGEDGEFFYRAGETIVFGLGNELEFPAVTAAQILTPLELAGVEDINDLGVTNMARLLQTLDEDCDASNGIVINGAVLLAAAGMSVDFEGENFDSEVQGLIASADSVYSTCPQLIAADDAIEHLKESLIALSEQTSPPIGDGLEGKIGVWEGAGEQGTNEYYPELATWTIMITLTEEEQTIEYALISDPSDPCGGTLSLIEESDAQLTFRETITYQGVNYGCVDQGFVELTDQNGESMIYRWYSSDENNLKGDLGAIGTVTRQ